MSKIVTLVALALVSVGCGVRTSSGTHFFLQRGIVLVLTHHCTQRAVVIQLGRDKPLGEIVGAAPKSFALEPVVWGEQYIHVMVQSLDETSRVVGTHQQSFNIHYEHTTTRPWTIRSYGYGGRGGGGGGGRGGGSSYSGCSSY